MDHVQLKNRFSIELFVRLTQILIDPCFAMTFLFRGIYLTELLRR